MLRSRVPFLFRMGTVVVTAGLVLVQSNLSRANHTPTPPPYTTSYYMNKVDTTTLYSLGCQLGTKDLNTPGTQSNLVILMYGNPMNQNGQYGANAYSAGFVSTSQIASAVQEFGHGYWSCTGSDTSSVTRIVVGTSNYGTQVTSQHAAAWASMVNSINQSLQNAGYGSQANAVGGSDMELAWNSPSVTKSWVTGYDSTNSYSLYNFGDAAGCPSTETNGNGSCSNGWTQDDVHYISWSAPPAYPAPQIYRTDGIQAKQWWSISVYGVKNNKGKLSFRSSLTQYQACQQKPQDDCTGKKIDNTPDQGWKQLWDAVNHDSRTTSTIPWSTDIKWYQP